MEKEEGKKSEKAGEKENFVFIQKRLQNLFSSKFQCLKRMQLEKQQILYLKLNS